MGANGGSILRRDAGEDSSASATFLLCVAAHDPRFRCVVVRDVGKPGISALPRIAAGLQTRRNFRFGSDLTRSPHRLAMTAICAFPPSAVPSVKG